MKEVSNEYKVAMKQNLRNNSTMLVAIGDINPILQTEAKGLEGASGQVPYFCRPYFYENGIVFRNGTDTAYSLLEQDLTKADGSMLFVPRRSDEAYYEDTGLVTNSTLSEASVTPIDIALPTEGVVAPLTIQVEFAFYCPTYIQVQIHGDSAYENVTITDNPTMSIKATFDTLPVCESGEYHIAILLSNNTVEEVERRGRIKRIVFGDGVCIFPDIIESAEASYYSSRINENLPTTDFTCNIVNYNARYDADNPDNPLAILDNKNQEINVYYGYDVENDGTYEWVKGCNVVASDWNSKQHTATITGVDRFRNNDTLFVHSYNTITTFNNVEWVIMYCLSKMFPNEKMVFTAKGTDVKMENQIIETKPCKETLQQLSSLCGTQMLFDENGDIMFVRDGDDTFEVDQHYDSQILMNMPVIFNIEMDKEDTVEAYVRFRVVGHNYYWDCDCDYTFYREMEERNNKFYFEAESFDIPEMLRVTADVSVDVLRLVETPDSSYFDMTKDDVLEDIVASKEDRVQEIISPYRSPNKVTQETSEVASIMCDISASQNEFKFDVDLGGTIYADKYVYQCDAEAVIPLSNFYEDSEINRTTGARETDTKATCSGFRSVTSGEYYRIVCDDDKIITGYGEYSTNATSGFIRWVDVNDDKCVKKIGSNCSYIRVEIRYPDDSNIDVDNLKKVRLAQAKRSSFKTPNDYAIVTVNKSTDFPNVDTLEIFVTAKSYYNFTSSDTSTAVNSDGKSIRWENPIASSKNEALDVTYWLKKYMKDHIVYDYQYRGNPEIEVGDIIKQENDFVSDMKVYVEEHKIGFNGALSGEIKTKRRYSE